MPTFRVTVRLGAIALAAAVILGPGAATAGTGAGIPDAPVALSVAPWGAHPPLPLPYPAPAPAPDGQTPLEPLNAAMLAAGLITAERPAR